jgi:peroxiredoxin
MHRIISYPIALLFAVTISAYAMQPVSDKTISAEKSFSDFAGVKVSVGQAMPGFTLPDGEGHPVSLSQFQGKQPVLLLFYRGDWCPYCMGQLEDYQNLLQVLDDYNIQLIAISPDSEATTKNTSHRFGQSYIFLSDTDRQVAEELGIRSDENLPHPSLFVVATDGSLLWYFVHTNHKARPSSQQVRKLLDDLFK